MYRLTLNQFDQPGNMIKKIEEGATTFIPFDPANSDYQAYLKWVAEGNTPLPADEPSA